MNEKKYILRDGDIVFSSNYYNPKGFISIFKEEADLVFWNYVSYHMDDKSLSINSHTPKCTKGFKPIEVRPATNKERKILFDAMAENHLKWNAKIKRIEKWTPEYNEIYFFLNDIGIDGDRNRDDQWDTKRIYMGNCFKSKEIAYKYFDKIKKLLNYKNHDPKRKTPDLFEIR